MRKKLRTIIEELGQKANIRRELASDLERLSSRLALYHIHLESASLKKIIGYFKGKEKPSKKTLDRYTRLPKIYFQAAYYANNKSYKNLYSNHRLYSCNSAFFHLYRLLPFVKMPNIISNTVTQTVLFKLLGASNEKIRPHCFDRYDLAVSLQHHFRYGQRCQRRR